MIRLAVHGAAGRTGRLVLAEALAAEDVELVGAVDPAAAGRDAAVLAGRPPGGPPVVDSPGDLPPCDVVVDFSRPEATADLARCEAPFALVVGTTGLGAPALTALEARAAHAPVLVAANFSAGIAVLRHLAARAAALLRDHDIEIVEWHHRHKEDAPSGTALALLASVQAVRAELRPRHGRAGRSPRAPEEVGLHAVRGGGIAGRHLVLLAGPGERLELAHEAADRRVFARGALAAARWIAGRPPGRHSFEEVLGLSPTGRAGGGSG